MSSRIESLLKSDALSADEKLCLFLLSLYFGSYFFLLNLVPYSGSVIGRNKEWLIFLTSLGSVPFLTVASIIVIQLLKRRYFGESRIFYPIILFWNTFWGLLFIWGLHYGKFSIAAVSILFPIMNLFALLNIRLGENFIRENGWVFISKSIYFVTPLMIGLTLLTFSNIKFSPYVILVPILALGCMYHEAIVGLQFGRKTIYFLDGMMLLFVFLIFIDPQYYYCPHHYNFYLGPTNDLLMGKSLLVDIYSQYGVLIYYFLALPFYLGAFPLSYQGLSLLISILLILQYISIYFLLRYMLQSLIFSMVAVSLMIIILFAGPDLIKIYPSSGPLRFGLTYILLVLVTLRTEYPKMAQLLVWMERSLLGVASLWSVESFFYVFSAYLGVLFYESIIDSRNSQEFARRVCKHLFWTLFLITVGYLLMTMAIRGQSGVWPNWHGYWEYLRMYSVTRFAADIPIEPWHPWVLILGIYFASLMLIAYNLFLSKDGGRKSGGLKVALAMTLTGLAQFTYFIMRSHINNLIVISLPAIFLSCYWIVHASKISLPDRFRFSFLYSCNCAMVLLFFVGGAGLKEKADSTLLYSLSQYIKRGNHIEALEIKRELASLWKKRPTDIRVVEAMYLIEKYGKNKERIPLFITHELTTETLMLAHKTNVFPISNPIQDAILDSAQGRILNFRHDLRKGDILFIETDYLNSADQKGYQKPAQKIQRDLVERLCKQLGCEPLEITDHGISAVKLGSEKKGGGCSSSPEV